MIVPHWFLVGEVATRGYSTFCMIVAVKQYQASCVRIRRVCSEVTHVLVFLTRYATLVAMLPVGHVKIPKAFLVEDGGRRSMGSLA
jgi:membrane protein required for beta-lactamase induction